MGERTARRPEAPRELGLAEFLKKNHVEIISEGNGEQFPEIIREKGFEKLSPIGKKVLADLAANCRFYLNGVIVRDTFGEDRPARRDFWNDAEEIYGKDAFAIHEKDKLRGNTIANVQSYFDWLVSELDKAGVDTPEAARVRELKEELDNTVVPEEYVGKTFEEKMEVAKKIDGIARTFLTMVTKD